MVYVHCCFVVTWLVPRETAAVSAHVLCTPHNHAPVYNDTASFICCCFVFVLFLFFTPQQIHGAENLHGAHLHIHLQCCLVVTWPVPRETAAVSAHIMCTPYNHAEVYSVASFKATYVRVHVC